MSKNFTNNLFLFAVTLILIITGCGSSGSTTASLATNAAQSKVFGVASLGTTATSTVTVKDSSVPTQEKTAALSSNGSFTADVSGFRAPFILKASGTDETGGNLVFYSVSANGGRTNINQISDLAVAAAASMDTSAAGMEMAYSWSNNDDNHRTAYNFDNIINSLSTILAPLYALYNVTGSPVTDDNEDMNSGLTAMLHDVQFTVTKRNVLVTNRATGGIIFSGPLNNLDSGTFYPEKMPAGPGGSPTCTYTYSDWGTCQSDGTQARTMTSSTSGCTGTPVLTQPCPYVPPVTTCTYNYSNWGACQSDGTQTRTVQSSPAGCTGTPGALSQTCTPTCTYTYSAWSACDSSGNQTRTVTATPAGCTGTPGALSQTCMSTCTYTYSAWSACDSTGHQTRTVTATPAVCTGTPGALSQTCGTSACTYTYSGWSACDSTGHQTRTVTATPAGCTGTPGALSQTCTPTCTYTYSGWSTCDSTGHQTRTVTSSPAVCTGTPGALSQTCTPTSTVTLANVTSSCTGCHGLTVNTTVFKTGGYTVTGRSANNWLTTVNNMVKYGSQLAPGTTATDYANFLAGLP